jgi:predicted dehydrogenase
MRLKYGMVGGAGGFIGQVHRRAIQLDDLADLKAGCFHTEMEENLKQAERWRVDKSRVYDSYKSMADAECSREDGIDFVTIVTPNRFHYEMAKYFLERKISVVCEKPAGLTVDEVTGLEALAEQNDCLFAIPYSYGHYPLVRQARKMVQSGKIGTIQTIIARYPEDWMAEGIATGSFGAGNWRFNSKIAGESGVTADLGTHLEYLISTVTGLKQKRLLAKFQYSEGFELETSSYVIAEYENNVVAQMWISQVATGHEVGISLEVIGDKGSIAWDHKTPTVLKYTPVGQPTEIYTPERNYLDPDVKRMSRIAEGHPEGFFEAFANVYREFTRHLNDRKNGTENGPYYYPNIHDGVDSARFVHACVVSQHEGNRWVDVEA